MSAKDAMIEMIRQMPDDSTAEEILNVLSTHFGESEWDREYIAEIERRIADMDSGKDPGIPHEDSIQRLREKYG